MNWEFWAILFGIIVAAEIIIPGFFLVPLALSALLLIFISLIHKVVWVQAAIFTGSAILFYLILIKFILKSLNQKSLELFHLNSLIGKTAIVKTPVDNSKNQGYIKCGPELFRARSVNNEYIDRNEEVVIQEIQGITCLVEKNTSVNPESN